MCDCEDKIKQIEEDVKMNSILLKDLYKFIEREFGYSEMFLPEVK